MNAPNIEVQNHLTQTLYRENSLARDVNSKSEILYLTNDPSTSSDLLDIISANCTIVIAESIARNTNASERTLQRLASHYNPAVRAAVTENSAAPIEVLSRLIKDENPDVRFAMAENFSTPKSLLKELMNDENPYVSSRAYATLERLALDFCENSVYLV
jgi:hypothetical protein